MIRFFTIAKFLVLLCSVGLVACTSLLPSTTQKTAPPLTAGLAREALNRQLSQPYAIYKDRVRFRAASDRQKLIQSRYLEQLEVDQANGFISYTQTRSGGFGFVDVRPNPLIPTVPVYALNKIGFAFPDGKRLIRRIESIEGDIVSFSAQLRPGTILKARGYDDTSKIFQGKVKMEFNFERRRYEIIVFEQKNELSSRWQKIGFEVGDEKNKAVFFIDPDTELLYSFLKRHEPKSEKFKVMWPFKKYIEAIYVH